MRYLGIDFGSRNVGLAVSDESNIFALPLKVLRNSKKLVDDIYEIACEKNITHIIIGESKNFQGHDNAIMKDIRIFKEQLENKSSLPVIYEPEFMTSQHAEMLQGKSALLDASAAALILQSYLDKINSASPKGEIK